MKQFPNIGDPGAEKILMFCGASPALPLELVDPRFYHLDTCFCPVAPGVAIYYPGAFDEYGR